MSAIPIGVAESSVEAGGQVRVRMGDDDEDFGGWYCVATDPWPCPAEGCAFVAHHVSAMHRIVVWPESDDRRMLNVARLAKGHGRNPRIAEYKRSMGPAVSYYASDGPQGRHVHGVRS